MLNIYDPTFYLEESDFLSVDGPLSSDNIDTTISDMVKNIANSLGYNECTSFDYNSFRNLDNIYDTTKSLVIPIFNEIADLVDSSYKLESTLTNANVSFLVLTPKCGEIKETGIAGHVKHYSCTNHEGKQLGGNPSTVGKVMCKRLTNIRLYRYLNDLSDDGKYDYNPICLDIISPIYYGYNDNDDSKEVMLCIEGVSNFYMKQQIMTISPENKLPLYPSNISRPMVGSTSINIKPIGGDSFEMNNVNINDLLEEYIDIYACHIYSKFYLLENKY